MTSLFHFLLTILYTKEELQRILELFFDLAKAHLQMVNKKNGLKPVSIEYFKLYN